MKDAIERAKSLSKRERHKQALEILEPYTPQLSKLPPNEHVMALDLLAALHEKQGLMSKAQSYAVRAVKLDPRDLRGYLRLGKILLLSGDKQEEAAKVYERALRRARISQPQQKEFLVRNIMLCKAHQSKPAGGMQDNGPQKARDPLHVLPIELLLPIFQTFNTRELVRICRVSKLWRRFIESQPQLWSYICISSSDHSIGNCSIGNSSNGVKKASEIQVVRHSTVLNYLRLSRGQIRLDLQDGLVKSPEGLIQALGRLNERVELLLFNNMIPVYGPASVQMLRSLRVPFNNLKELRITTDTPARDLAWCVTKLPSLEFLDLVTTQQLYPSSRQIDLVVTSRKLHALSILGNSGTTSIPETQLENILAQLPELVRVDIHRVASIFWPALSHLFSNPRLEKFGFTGEGDTSLVVSLPRFVSSEMRSITLNNVSVAPSVQALVMPVGDPFRGGPRGIQRKIEYLELKRTELVDSSVCELIDDWGCTESLEVLVLHALRQTETWLDGELPRLHTLQYTHMNALSNQTLDWLVKNCPALRKINLDGTSITGPQIVKLLTSLPTLVAVRCANLMDASADTVAWLTSLPGRNIIFGNSGR